MSVPDAGLTELLNRIFGVSTGAMPYLAVGSGSTAPAAGDTALETESVRVLASVLSIAGPTATLRAFFTTSQGNITIRETGMLTAAVAGTLLDRSLESPVQAKNSTQEMIVEYAVTLARG